jgi:DNA-binding NarL/FixJ family response regulator
MIRIRVALADDHPIVLAGVRSLLQDALDMEVVGNATDGQAVLALLVAATPDVAVIDISMPGLNGIELARRVAQDCPSVRLMALTVHEDQAYLQQMLAAGARGYLLKRSAAEELVRAVRAVAAGGLFLDPAIAGKALAVSLAAPTASGAPEPATALSPREEDVLRHTARGLSNKEIGSRLEISTKTVETYKARAVEKLGLRSRSEVVRHAARRGWLNDQDDA